MPRLRLSLVAVASGALGFLLMWGGWHLIEDHARLHQIWDLELRRAQALQQAGVPAPPGP